MAVIDTMFPTKHAYDMIVSAGGQPGVTHTTLGTATAATIFGTSTTQFDITNPAGSTYRYTYDGTGTDPGITALTVQLYKRINIAGQNFNAANNDLFYVTGSGANYFEVTNASGVAENNVTIGTGVINLCSKFLAYGKFEESADLAFMSGQQWHFADVALYLDTDYRVIYSNIESVVLTGRLDVYGDGLESGTLLSLWQSSGVENFNAENCEISLSMTRVATIGAAFYTQIFSDSQTNTHCRYNLILKPTTLATDTKYLHGLHCLATNSFFKCQVTDLVNSTDDLTVGVYSNEASFSSFEVIVDTVTRTGGSSHGVEMATATKYRSIIGTSRNCGTNIAVNGDDASNVAS